MTEAQPENTWGERYLRGPASYPAFTIELTDFRDFEGPGNVSSRDYYLAVSDGELTIHIETTNRRGIELFEFRGQKYEYQVHDNDDGFSCSVRPRTNGPGGTS